MKTNRLVGATALAAALALLGGCQMMGSPAASSHTQVVTLTGKNEVPPNDSTAVGQGTVTVTPDRSVKVKVTVSGMAATAAHIHEGASGSNGPVIVPLDKSGDNEFVSKAEAKLTEAQYDAFKASRTYLNVHSTKHAGGEVRAQLQGR